MELEIKFILIVKDHAFPQYSGKFELTQTQLDDLKAILYRTNRDDNVRDWMDKNQLPQL